MYSYHTGQKKVCADMPTALSHPLQTTKKLNLTVQATPAQKMKLFLPQGSS